MALTFILITILLVIRGFELNYFLKRVSRVCERYDWKYIDEFGHPLVDVLKDENNYFVKCEWSAYNFLFMKGPNPLLMYFSLKPLRIEEQYNETAIKKLEKYGLV